MAGYTVSSVTSGKYARQITVAASGPQGAQGPAGPAGVAGPVGPTGPQGEAGAGLSANYKFNNSVSSTDPGGGYLALNDVDFSAATELYISETDAITDAQLGLLNAMTQSTNTYKSIVTFQSNDNTRAMSRHYVRSVTSNSGWRTFVLVYLDGTVTEFSYNESISLLVAPIGDAGIVNNFEDLNDVDFVDPIQGDVASYDAANAMWTNVHSTQLQISGQNISGTIEGGSASTF